MANHIGDSKMTKYMFISPHLDDAVLSCGQMIDAEDNTEIVTVFGGIPQSTNDYVTAYDKKSGFSTSFEAMMSRREEDKAACKILKSTYQHLPYLDIQYVDDGIKSYDLDEIKMSIKRIVDSADVVIAPLGLMHSNHTIVSELVLNVTHNTSPYKLWLYEELPYRVIEPEIVFDRINFINECSSHHLEFIPTSKRNFANKEKAIQCYKSQYNTGDINMRNLLVPERYWEVKWN